MLDWNEVLPYRVPEAKRLRLIVNTDAANEADDPFAIAHALLTPRFDIRGLIGAHYGARDADSMERSCREIEKLLRLMRMDARYAATPGAPAAMEHERGAVVSPGSDLIVREAMRDDDARPLFVVFLGPLTDLAAAYLSEPRIADRLTAVWIGGGTYPDGGAEFNAGNDIAAANVVLGSGIPLWQVPKNVYSMIRVSLAELAVKVRPHGELGRYLFEQLVDFNERWGDKPAWPKGEMWMLGDSPAVSLLLDDHAFEYDMRPAPRIRADGKYEHASEGSGRLIRVYRYVDSRFTLEDMYAKLALFHEATKEG
ncbi:nucleoside hydrolase [Paenibacillus sp.]|uniref:nucleoside hydrolase n=1 Tax=Paenibacillus sp. TaxID=58172 RepID=UPI002810D453|nr:nucleoside hydrolase [Paenibacillus sp.]